MKKAKRLKKSLTPKQAAKLKPGTWLQISWNDSKDTLALLIEHEIKGGEPTLSCYYPKRTFNKVNEYATYTQVVAILGKLKMPKLLKKQK
jgi:hypothetical protein